MYYIGLDVHKKSISYRMKDASDQIYAERRDSCNTIRSGQMAEDSQQLEQACNVVKE